MKLGITGTRKFTDYKIFRHRVDRLKPTELISGGAKGADALAERYASDYDIPITVILPKFKIDPETTYHPRWYLERNKDIVNQSDVVLAFWDQHSRGTNHTIKYARSCGTPVIIISTDHP